MIAVARAHDDGSGTLTLAGATQTVSTDSLEEAMAELIALVVDHARVTGRDVELVAHADGTRTGLRIDPDGGIVEDDRILAASLSRTRQLEEDNITAKSRRRRGRARDAGTAAAPVLAPAGIDDCFPAPPSDSQDLDEPAVEEPAVVPVDEPLVDDTGAPAPEDRPRRTWRAATAAAAAAAAAGTASAPSGTSRALQATRTRVLAALPPRSSAAKSARVLLASAAVAALLGGAGYVAVSNGSSDEPGAAPTTAPVGSASSSSTPSPTAPTTAATPLAPARVVALSRAPGRIVMAVGGLTAGERVTITVRAKNGKVRTLQRVVTDAPIRWTLTKLASGTARWRVQVEGHRDATGTVRVKTAPPAPPPPVNPAPQPDPDPAPVPDPPKGGGGGGGGGGVGGGGGPVDPATQLPGPVG